MRVIKKICFGGAQKRCLRGCNINSKAVCVGKFKLEGLK